MEQALATETNPTYAIYASIGLLILGLVAIIILLSKKTPTKTKTKKVGKEEKETPVKSILLIALLIFIILCCITVIAGIIELLCYRALTGQMAWIDCKGLVMRLLVYAVISLPAAGFVYYGIRKGEGN